MKSGPHKKNILTVLLLCCFSIYAISPLAGTFQLGSSTLPVGSEIEQPAFKIYIIHFLLSSLFDVKSNDTSPEQDDQTGDHCLIKKKRVIFSIKNLRSILSLSMVEVSTPRTGPTEATLYERLNISSARPYTDQNPITSLHSGNAPPLS